MNGIILLPSYNRSELLKRFLRSYEETKTTTECKVLVDKKDPQLNQYQNIDYPKGTHLVLTNERSMGGKCRELWDQYKDLDFTCILNDDHILKTEQWDIKCQAAITGTNVIGTNDGWVAPARLAGATVWSGKVLRTVGYLFPEFIDHLYIDSVWEFLCAKAQCANILMDVLVEHQHVFKEAQKNGNMDHADSTHKEIYKKDWNDAKEVGSAAWHFDQWLTKHGEADAQKLLNIQPKMGLMIATPSHDGNCAMGYALGLTDMAVYMASHNVYFEMARIIGSSLIPHARNSLVDMFLKSRCQKLLFIDADQGFDKNAALHLFQSNKRIIAGITPHKRFPINFNFEPLPEDHKYFKSLSNKGPEELTKYVQEKADPKGEIEVNRVGTGFIMIDRSVFDIMAPLVANYAPFDENDKLTHKEFFRMGAVEGTACNKFRGEDWLFCELAKSLKIPLFINANAIVSHMGTYNFEVQRQA